MHDLPVWAFLVPPALVLLWIALTYNALVRLRQHVSE